MKPFSKAPANHGHSFLAGLLLTAFLVAGGSGESLAQDADVVRTLAMETGVAQVVRIPPGATDVIVGNPEIANVSLLDARTVLVTPVKSGVTNLLVLDTAKTPLSSIKLSVDVESTSQSKPNNVRVYRQIGNDAAPEAFECGSLNCRQLQTGKIPADLRRAEMETFQTSRKDPENKTGRQKDSYENAE